MPPGRRPLVDRGATVTTMELRQGDQGGQPDECRHLVRARIDSDTKARATEALRAMMELDEGKGRRFATAEELLRLTRPGGHAGQ